MIDGLSGVIRRPASRAELTAIVTVAFALAGFGVYGAVVGVPGTATYLVIIIAVAALVGWFRTVPLPDLLVFGLAVDAVSHLAGGLIRVGDDVLYNASIGPTVASLDTHILQYDHFAHAFGSFVGTLTLWHLLAPSSSQQRDSRNVIVLCVVAGFGLGAANETIEFLATLAHSGQHVGGYSNVGWDLVSNTLGAVAAAPVIRRTRMGLTPP